jgi:hypothetical protein
VNEAGRAGPEGQPWRVTGAGFAQANAVTAEAHQVESFVIRIFFHSIRHAEGHFDFSYFFYPIYQWPQATRWAASLNQRHPSDAAEVELVFISGLHFFISSFLRPISQAEGLFESPA